MDEEEVIDGGHGDPIDDELLEPTGGMDDFAFHDEYEDDDPDKDH
jgi:hypothetical protein